jgi:hypothetical protein
VMAYSHYGSRYKSNPLGVKRPTLRTGPAEGSPSLTA